MCAPESSRKSLGWKELVTRIWISSMQAERKMFFLFTEKHCLFSIGSVAASTERRRPSGPNTSSPMARSAIVLQPDGVAIGVLSANALPLPFPISRSGHLAYSGPRSECGYSFSPATTVWRSSSTGFCGGSLHDVASSFGLTHLLEGVDCLLAGRCVDSASIGGRHAVQREIFL